MEEDLVCFCLGYSEADIIKDVLENKGTSAILKRILSEKKQGSCNCRYSHPEGR